jgi:hypothetical protein
LFEIRRLEAGASGGANLQKKIWAALLRRPDFSG